jgi:hypothetical protein
MLQIQCVKIRIIDGKSERVRSWVASLGTRRDEVRAALAVEGIADEAVFFASERAGDFLYLYSRAPDLASAAAAFQSSSHAVDVEFRGIMTECLEIATAAPLELLFAADNSGRS